MRKILNLLISLFSSIKVFNKKNRVIDISPVLTAHAKYWLINDELHRTDGPAIEYINGDKEWYINGLRHREDGPAIEYSSGFKEWWINGKKHREDGPAVELFNDYKWWYLNNVLYSEEEYQNELIKLKLKRLIEL